MEKTLGLLLFGFSVCYGQNGTYIYQATLCDNAKTLLICQKSQIMFVKGFTNGDAQCKSAVNYQCLNKIDIAIRTSCNGKNNCTLGPSLLSTNDCKPTPRYIVTTYECTGWFSNYRVSETCTNALSAINCESYTSRGIKIKEVSTNTLNMCADCDEKEQLKDLCNGEKRCSDPSNYKSCLFLQELTLTYYCMDTTDMPSTTYSVAATDNYTKTDFPFMPSPTYSVAVTDNYTNTDVDYFNLNLDGEGRVLISNVLENTTVMLCGVGWDDHDAQVVCRFKENSSIGYARVIEGVPDYETRAILIHCNGNETNLFLCNHIFMDNCSSFTVAAVKCCDDGSGLTKMCTSPNAKQLSSSNGVAVGVSVGVITLIVIAATVFLLIKRCRYMKNDKLYSSDNTNGDYIGNQVIALPSFSSISNHTASNDDDRPYMQNDVNSRNVPSRNNFSSPTYSLNNALETGTVKTGQVNDGYEYAKSMSEEKQCASGGTYACSVEGLYDKGKNNRDVQTELNVYSHSIDTVYDTSDRNRNQEHTIDTYDHFFGQKNDNNYDIAIRK